MLLALPLALCAEKSGAPSFFRLTSEQGLSNSTVNDIFTDERGVVWIATKDGLNSYDGRSIRVFRQDGPGAGNLISRITGDCNGHLFLLLPGYLSSFDMRDCSFTNMECSGAECILFRDSLFVGMRNEVRCLSRDSRELSLYASLDKGEEITSMTFAGDRLVAGTRQGHVFCFRKGGGAEMILNSGKVADVYTDKCGNIWTCTWTDGLYRTAPDGSVRNFRHSGNSSATVTSDFVRTCCEDAHGRLWIGTIKGLDCMDTTTGMISHVENDPSSRFSLSDESIWKIRRDRQGNMWVATYYGGVDFFNPEADMYTRYSASTKEGTGLSNSIIGEMVEDGDFIWIATEGGLDRLDRRSGEIRWYGIPGKKEPKMEHVKALWLDKDARELWVGADMGGLFRVNCPAGRVEAFYHNPEDPGSIPGDRVRDIIPYGTDSLIVATQSGICVFSRRSGRARPLLHSGKPFMVTIDEMLDSEGRLWVKEGEGTLSRLDPGSGEFKKWTGEGAPGKFHSCTFQDSSGRIWAGSLDSGLYLYDREGDVFVPVSKGIFSSGCIYAISELHPGGDIIAATGCGFSVFSPESGSARNFDHPGGFPFSSAYENALLVTADGTVFIGSTQGLVSFSADDIYRGPGRSDILVRSYSCGGEEFQPGWGCDGIQVRSGVPLSFDVAVTDFAPSAQNRYEYMLEGFSKEWTVLDNNSYRIDIPRLKAGKYILRIRSAEADEAVCTPVRLNVSVSRGSSLLIALLLIMALAIVVAAVMLNERRRRGAPGKEGSTGGEETPPTPSQILYNKARSVVEENLANPDFDIQQFCTQMGMSRTVLFEKIKKVSDKTPNDFILGIRLEKAADMLRRDYGSSVAVIAEKTGFRSSAYFSQKFKEVYGVTPLAFRKREMPE